MKYQPRLLDVVQWRRLWEEEGCRMYDLVDRHFEVMGTVRVCRKRGVQPRNAWLAELGVGACGALPDYSRDDLQDNRK